VSLAKGEVYVKTLLERAKGSPLDIITNHNAPVGTITLLSPHARQIRSLNFTHNYWTDIQRFSEVSSGQQPLLHTLEINVVQGFWSVGRPDPMSPPSLPFFSNAINLEQFVLRSENFLFLNHFVFPNLTTFELSTTAGWYRFQAADLLDFLEASPMLRTVDMKIIARILLDGVAQRRVVILPKVHTFSLVMDGGEPGYDLAAHISCPSASHTSLIHEKTLDDILTSQDIRDAFPTIASWNTIVRQYTRNPAEVVTLEIKLPHNSIIACTLTFQSSDMTVIRLGLEVSGDDKNEPQMPFGEMALEVFSQASRAVRNHPLLPEIKRLHITCGVFISEPIQLRSMANEVGRLFESVGPLDELTLRSFDLRSYLPPFFDLPEFKDVDQSVVFPPIKELTISHPLMVDNEEECMAAIVELAKSQHALGVPFERVTVRVWELPAGMAEMLEPWVGVADCCEEQCALVYDE